MIPPPARSNHPSFSRHLHPLVQPASCIALFVGPSLLSVPAPTLPPRPRLFSIRRGNRCCSGPELVQNRWARATSASRRGVGYPCRFALLLGFLVPLLVSTPRSRSQPELYIYTYTYNAWRVCSRDGVAVRWRWNGAKAKRRDDEQYAAHA